ncbi:MAG: PD-(D/E)XK nuclease family protein [Gemmatimonadaceae bacterium]
MTTASVLLGAVEALDRAHPFARKRLVGPDVNFGRELLVTLARRTGGWVGWEATNLRGIAQALAFLPLAERGRRVADDVTINALVNRALARAIEGGKVGKDFAALAPGLGFRRAVLDTLLELRLAGVGAAELRASVSLGTPASNMPAILVEYEKLLAHTNLADTADVFRSAIDAFKEDAPYVLDGIIAIVPTRPARGLPGQLLDRLLAHGARMLDVDPIPVERALHAQVEADFFAATTPSDELREVCRRVAAEGLRWDEVEIVATDGDTYGTALDALGQRLELGATMLQGVPLARTRIGRALDRWLGWLDDDLSADVLRQALEGGELALPGSDLPSTVLARELRGMKIGWGRKRYERAIDRLASGKATAGLLPQEDESDEEFAARRGSRERSAKALGALLVALLATTPAVPERGSDRTVRSSSAALARATLGFLALCPVHGPAEEQTMERLRERLDALGRTDDEVTTFSTALAALRESVADLRAWPMITSDRKPWSAAGAMLHLTTLSHAGTTGRRRIFVVGFDAERTSGVGRQDPLLPDMVRRAVGGGRLVTSVERREESALVTAGALASLRGRVTFSYATSSTLDGRDSAPSPLMLQMWRERSGDPGRSYDDLRRALHPPASAVPVRNEKAGLVRVVPLDGRDVWLDALADGPLLLDGTSAVRDAFPVLAAGFDAFDVAAGSVLTAFHGLIPAAGPVLDPTAQAGREISPSSLETLAKCPLSWFYRYGLSLRPFDDPEYDEDHWLDALQRGSLLHEVFEEFTRAYQGRQGELASADAEQRMRAIAGAAVARWRDDVPPPAETVFEAEREEIQRAGAAFLQMERDRHAAGDGGTWRHFELRFGRGEGEARFLLTDGRVLLTNGRADRVDEMPDGSLRVIDYKTGKPKGYGKNPRAGPFNGGRQLQPALYLAAVEAVTGKSVSSFEYRFPTERGGNEVVAYTSVELAGVNELVTRLLEHVPSGAFVPTNDVADCSYCEYGEICRARRNGFGTVSPRAAWGKAHAEGLPMYAGMMARRTPEAK